MRFDDTRDNITDTEDTIIEADNRETAGWFFDAVVTDEDDIEEDDHQPSEYDEWQDYFGGDEYYDHSESVWGEGY
ncbi:MAG: hypothetical protein CL398_10995 [Acidiferrobacteraceae bacterium]|nr:hypothetical protein [Acidiferrobacteraceae bacterium]|tara:strand:+ start:369 stop:593 length:225 start_codon:yes stop_codon:yes gene_type:complete